MLDPDGTDPLLDPTDTDRLLDPAVAAEAAHAFAGEETDRWLLYLAGTGLMDPSWKPQTDRSMDELWSCVPQAVDADLFVGCDWREIAEHPPVPLLLRLEPGLESSLGWRGTQVAAAVVAGATRWLESNWGATWTVAELVGDISATPVLAIPTGRGFLPQSQIPVRVKQAARGLPDALEPDSLRDLLYRHGPGTGTPLADDLPAADSPEWALDTWENSDFNWGLSMDDLTAHEQEIRVEQLVALLAAHEAVERCIHEDRELVLIASALDHESLMDAVRSLWQSTDPG